MYRQRCSRDESANIDDVTGSSPSHRRYSNRTLSMPAESSDIQHIRNGVFEQQHKREREHSVSESDKKSLEPKKSLLFLGTFSVLGTFLVLGFLGPRDLFWS